MELGDAFRSLTHYPGYILIAVLVAAAIVGYVFILPGTAAKTYRISVVTEDGSPLNGALVEVFDGARRIAQATTQNGAVLFPILPAKNLQVKVSKSGLEPITETLDARTRTSLRIEFPGTGEGGGSLVGFTVKVLDRANQRPIAGAKVRYAYDDSSGTATSSSAGIARVPAPVGTQVALHVSHANYSYESISVLSQQSKEQVVMMRRSTGAVHFAASLAPRGMLIVTVLDDANRPVVSGTLRVKDASTSTLLQTGSIVNGTATLSGILLGARVYLEAEVSGFLPYSGADAPFEIEPQTLARVRLTNQSNGAPTRFTTRNKTGSAAEATIYVIPAGTTAPLKELKTTLRANGSVSINLSVDKSYYAVASAPGSLLPTISNSFRGGASVTLTLEPVNSTNAGHLQVKAVDEDGRALSGVSILVITKDQFYTAAGKTINTGEFRIENLRASERFLVRGYYQGVNVTGPGEISVRSPVVLASLPRSIHFQSPTPRPVQLPTAVVTLNFELTTAFADVTVVDAITDHPLAATVEATASLGRSNATACYASADSGTCDLRLRTQQPYSISASAPGYAPTSATLALRAGERKPLTLRLFPASFVNETRADLVGLYDSGGFSVDFLRPGGTYTARFRLLALPGVHESALYVRVGQKDSVVNDTVGITHFPSADRVSRATTYKPSRECLDLDNNTAVNGQYKWIELSYNSGGVHEVDVEFQVSPLAPSGVNTTLYYRALARFEKVHTRFPIDSRLGTSSNSTALAGCYANTIAYPVTIIASPELDPALGKNFTEQAAISYNPATGQVESTAREFVLQVDAFLPADALPLKFSPQEVLVTGINSTAGTEACYTYDNSKSLLVFQAQPLRPTCPLGMVGGRAPSDESASISFYYTRSPNLKLTVPIKVTSANTSSLALSPTQVEGDGTPRLLYLTNNLQLGRRTVQVESADDKRAVPLDAPTVRPLALVGPDGISLSEGDFFTANTTYQTEKSYFEGLSGQGSSLEDSCETSDCCTTSWCTQQQASIAASLIARKAQVLADQTVFRRGNGQPYLYFNNPSIYGTTRPFTFQAIVQAREGAVLRPANATTQDSAGFVQLPPGFRLKYESSSLALCTADAPIVYQLSAESQNGTSWTLTASVPFLSNFNYYGGSCITGSATPTTEQTARSIPLCGFLYGESIEGNTCLKRVTHTITPSLEQASEEHAQVLLVDSPFDPTNATNTCSDASANYAQAVSDLSGVCSRVAGSLLGCAQGTEPLTNCGAANCKLQEAMSDCNDQCSNAMTACQLSCAAGTTACNAICFTADTEIAAAVAAATEAVTAAAACTVPAATGPAAAGQAAVTKAKLLMGQGNAAGAEGAVTAAAKAFTGCAAGATAAVDVLCSACASSVAASVATLGIASISAQQTCTLCGTCGTAAAACGTAAGLSEGAAATTAGCLVKQSIILGLEAGAVSTYFNVVDTNQAYQSSSRSMLKFQEGAGPSCNGPIGELTGALVGASTSAAGTVAGQLLANGKADTGKIIYCALEGIACSVACGVGNSQCGQRCSTRGGACGESLQAASSAAGRCENTKGYLYESPGNLPPRAAWYTCYPYPDGCRPACQAKRAIAQLVPYQNQMYLINREGLTPDCQPISGEVAPSLANLPPSSLLPNLAQYRERLPVEMGFLGNVDAFSDPLSGTPEFGDSSKSEPVAEKGTELDRMVTDETTQYVWDKSNVQVIGGQG